jgi:hypothetical protein
VADPHTGDAPRVAVVAQNVARLLLALLLLLLVLLLLLLVLLLLFLLLLELLHKYSTDAAHV